jgi:holo-[acyl-carrier protein] synthase
VRVGVDAVDIDRFRKAISRTSGLVERVFTDAERAYAELAKDPAERFAVRWAAKEAAMKVLGAGIGEVRFRDIEVVRARDGRPSLVLHDRAAAIADELGLSAWDVSLTHSGLVAIAVVVGVATSTGAG